VELEHVLFSIAMYIMCIKPKAMPAIFLPPTLSNIKALTSKLRRSYYDFTGDHPWNVNSDLAEQVLGSPAVRRRSRMPTLPGIVKYPISQSRLNLQRSSVYNDASGIQCVLVSSLRLDCAV